MSKRQTWSEKDLKTLLELGLKGYDPKTGRAAYGTWTNIGKVLNRRANTCNQKFYNICAGDITNAKKKLETIKQKTSSKKTNKASNTVAYNGTVIGHMIITEKFVPTKGNKTIQIPGKEKRVKVVLIEE